MSNDEPTITVTRGPRSKQSKRKRSSSTARSQSSGLSLPGPGAVISGAVRGVRNAWWAGLGVLAMAEKAGSQVFEALVEEGKSWEQARRERTRTRSQQVQRLAEETEAVDMMEERVREEIGALLQQAGLPRRDHLEALRDRVDALSQKIEHLAQSVEDARGEPGT